MPIQRHSTPVRKGGKDTPQKRKRSFFEEEDSSEDDLGGPGSRYTSKHQRTEESSGSIARFGKIINASTLHGYLHSKTG